MDGPLKKEEDVGEYTPSREIFGCHVSHVNDNHPMIFECNSLCNKCRTKNHRHM